MVNTLSDVEGGILDCKKAIEEFDNELLQLHWDVFDRIQGQFKDLDSELSNLRELFKDSKVTDGDSGWSKEGIAQLGLLTQQYEVAQRQIQQYNDAISKLNDDYKSGKYSATEYMDKLSDLTSGQWDAVKSSESVKEAIMELNETRINEEISAIEKEIDAYKELIDAQIEALKSAKDLHDYQRQIAEKTKSVTELERQIAAMKNDDSAATVAKRKQLEAQLAEARKALEEAEYQHSIEEQENALNKEFENYESERNAEIEKLRASLEEREALIAASFETVKQNAEIVGQEIASIAAEHGIKISDAVITAWQNGENAVASYGTVLTENSSAFIGNLMGVENEVYNLQSQANMTAESLSYMFASRADNLVNELANSYYAEENLNNMTRALNDSLVKTLESGYNISSLTNAIGSIIDGVNGIASAARNATQALSEMGAARQNANNSGGSGKGSSGKGSGSGGGNGGSGDWHTNQYVRFAKGGIVKKDKDDPLNPIAESLGEDRMVAVKEGEGVFTKEQTELLKKMVTENGGEIREDGRLYATKRIDKSTGNGAGLSIEELTRASALLDIGMSYPAQMVKQPETVPNNVNNRNSEVHVGSLITVQGNIDSSNVKQMEAIADRAVGKFAKELDYMTRFGRV
jgi:predicted  nucleic acid-binding Zn-ribbon protein